MRAHKIFEKFKEESDPISDMSIGYLAQIEKKLYKGEYKFSKLHPNMILVIAVREWDDDIDTRIELIKYAIKSGADQLWKPEGCRYYNFKLVQILDAQWSSGPHLKIIYKEVWSQYQIRSSIQSSTQFSYKFEAITTESMNVLDENLYFIEKIKKAIDTHTSYIGEVDDILE